MADSRPYAGNNSLLKVSDRRIPLTKKDVLQELRRTINRDKEMDAQFFGSHNANRLAALKYAIHLVKRIEDSHA